MVTINSAIEVDLSGQVNAEVVGERYIGAVGGQVDYVRAGARARGGLSIIAMPAATGSPRSPPPSTESGSLSDPCRRPARRDARESGR